MDSGGNRTKLLFGGVAAVLLIGVVIGVVGARNLPAGWFHLRSVGPAGETGVDIGVSLGGELPARATSAPTEVARASTPAPAGKPVETAGTAVPKDRIVDKIDYPFVDDPDVVGVWKSVDFVDSPDQFSPAQRHWGGDLFLRELAVYPGGATGGESTWTKGLIIHPLEKTASRYELVNADNATYMFFEWKSGDYTIRGMKPKYYVLKKEPWNIAGPTILMAASRLGGTDWVRKLMEMGVDENARDDMGNTPLHLAAGNGKIDTAKVLIDAGADVSATDAKGCTALHLAAEHSQEELARMLIAKGADVKARDKTGRTPEQMMPTLAQEQSQAEPAQKAEGTG